MSKQPPPAPTASAIGPCFTVIQIVGRPVTGSLHNTIALLESLKVHMCACVGVCWLIHLYSNMWKQTY